MLPQNQKNSIYKTQYIILKNNKKEKYKTIEWKSRKKQIKE